MRCNEGNQWSAAVSFQDVEYSASYRNTHEAFIVAIAWRYTSTSCFAIFTIEWCSMTARRALAPKSRVLAGSSISVIILSHRWSMSPARASSPVTSFPIISLKPPVSKATTGQPCIMASNAAFEAMMQGCPVVALDTGGLREIIGNDVTGLLARAGDIDHLCDRIMTLIEDPARTRDLGANARRAVMEHHSIVNIAKQLVDVYRQAIATMKAS